jgi:hypothetical protein
VDRADRAPAQDGFEASARALGRRRRSLTEVSARAHLALTRVVAGYVDAGDTPMTRWASRARVLLALGDLDGARSAALQVTADIDWATIADILAGVEARLVLGRTTC